MPPIPRADRLLRRITTLHEQFRQDDDAPSRLERDLMLGYLRELYALYAEEEDTPPRPKPSPPAPRPEPVAPPPPPPPAPEPEPVRTAIPTEFPAPAAPPPPTPPTAATRPDDEPTRQQLPPVPTVPVPPPPAPSFTAHTAHREPLISDRPAPNPPQPASTPNLSPEVEALFREEEQAGIASRIIRQRVTDLNRALSINNRVLYANRLFDGNESLNHALKTLNLRGSFANAKPLLVDLAQQHDWTREDRQETAREFIDIVRRRYA